VSVSASNGWTTVLTVFEVSRTLRPEVLSTYDALAVLAMAVPAAGGAARAAGNQRAPAIKEPTHSARKDRMAVAPGS
jgi:hypothetical protein